MTFAIDVADIVNPETGKTFRQENSEMTHKIPLWSLVEVQPFDTDGEDYGQHTGIRAYVCEHARDCDQTPLYSLTILTKEDYERTVRISQNSVFETSDGRRWKGEIFAGPDRVTGFSEDSLLVIRGPKE